MQAGRGGIIPAPARFVLDIQAMGEFELREAEFLARRVRVLFPRALSER